MGRGRPVTDAILVREAPGRQEPWGVFWRALEASGERRRRAVFYLTEAEARAEAAAIEAERATIVPNPLLTLRPATATTPEPPRVATARTGSLTFQTFAVDWLASVVGRKTPSTRRSYSELLSNHVYAYLGPLRVHEATLGTQQIVGLAGDLAARGVSWGTQKAVLRVVSSCLRWAVRYGHLRVNPVAGLLKELKDESNPDYADPEPNPLMAAEADAFLHWLQTGVVRGSATDRPVDGPKHRGGALRYCGYPEWHPYLFALLRTGMRRGEAAALKWSTVYLDRTPPRARLEATYSPSARMAATTAGAGDTRLKTKTPHEIDLAPALVEVLLAMARTRREAALKARRPLSPYVFVTPRGTRILSDSSTAERIFERGMTALGLAAKGHTIHDLRDTFATLHLMKDPGRLFWVSWMLGHKKTSTTLNRYTKWVPALTGGHTFAGDLDAPAIGGRAATEEGR